MCSSKTVIISLAVGLIVSTVNGIDIDNFDELTNDRFANDSSFVLAGRDLSGIGRSSDNRWASLVSRNVFLSSNHFHPGIGATVTFFETNDPNGNSFSTTVTSGQQIVSTGPDASDIWAGVLDTPVPAGYAFYPFAQADSGATFTGTNHFMFGRSPSAGPVIENVAVGTNSFTTYGANVTAQGTTDEPLLSDDNQLLATSFEALVEVGDSGAPTLAEINGNLTIVGTNWIVASVDGGVLPSVNASGFAYTGDHSRAIQDVINANPIPEPQVFALISGVAALTLVFSRRRQAS